MTLLGIVCPEYFDLNAIQWMMMTFSESWIMSHKWVIFLVISRDYRVIKECLHIGRRLKHAWFDLLAWLGVSWRDSVNKHMVLAADKEILVPFDFLVRKSLFCYRPDTILYFKYTMIYWEDILKDLVDFKDLLRLLRFHRRPSFLSAIVAIFDCLFR